MMAARGDLKIEDFTQRDIAQSSCGKMDDDTEAEATWVADKLAGLRLFPGDDGSLVGTERSVTLAGLAVDVKAGEKLFLTVSPVSDMSAASGSRQPGAFVLRGTKVQLPVVK